MLETTAVGKKWPAVWSLLSQLQRDSGDAQWTTVDYWDALLDSVGIAACSNPRWLAFISVGESRGNYDIICEEPTGPEPTDFKHTCERYDLRYAELLDALAAHLSSANNDWT